MTKLPLKSSLTIEFPDRMITYIYNNEQIHLLQNGDNTDIILTGKLNEFPLVILAL